MKKFRCTVCGYVYEGDAAPEKCPLCKAPASKFVEVVEVEGGDRKSTRLNSSHNRESRMPSSA